MRPYEWWAIGVQHPDGHVARRGSPDSRADQSRPLSSNIRDRARLRLAVRRQEADCRQVAERLGWSVECVYIDNGLSASQFATKPRDDYKRLLGDIREGRLDAVVVWMEDRSHRQVIELAEFVKTCQAAGISRYASVGTEYDLSDPDQVTMLFSIARMSETEARRMSIRVKRSLKELAGAGQYHGGPKPYGYEGPIKDENGVVANRARIGKAIVDEEAMIIREAARRILNGESLRSVVIDLNRRGIPAPRGALDPQDAEGHPHPPSCRRAASASRSCRRQGSLASDSRP